MDDSATLSDVPAEADWDRLARIPEKAIDAFERLHGVNVAVHDLTGLLGAHLEESRGYHRHPICQATKASGYGHRCYTWEVENLRPRLQDDRDGRVRICHAGLLEWTVPVFIGDTPALVLFAGPRTPGRTLLTIGGTPIERDRPTPRTTRRLPDAVKGERDTEAMLEALRQLGARLHAWLIEARARLGRKTPRSDEPRRDSLVRQFVHENHTRPIAQSEIAALLGLSPSRSAHVVRQLTGRTLAQLVHDARVQTASWLLTQTDLPLKEIIRRVGYTDLSHFHRTFRRKTGVTPAKYRRRFRV